MIKLIIDIILILYKFIDINISNKKNIVIKLYY